MIKILVTNFILCKNNYLKLPIGKVLNKFKKQYGNGYSFLVNVISVPDSDIFTIHSTESPFPKFNKSLIVFGMDVDNVPPVDWTLVLYFNFIPPYIHLIIFIIIYLVILLYKF